LSAALLLKPGTFVFGNDFGKDSLSNSDPDSHTQTIQGRSYSREMFEPYIGDVFRVRVGKQMVDLKLVALTNVERASHGITTGKSVRTDCFSMRFHAATPLPAKSNIRQLNHKKLGAFDLFMTQSREGGKFLQTAIVNHLV